MFSARVFVYYLSNKAYRAGPNSEFSASFIWPALAPRLRAKVIGRASRATEDADERAGGSRWQEAANVGFFAEVHLVESVSLWGEQENR